jgi:hypothetical protein
MKVLTLTQPWATLVEAQIVTQLSQDKRTRLDYEAKTRG